jgi:hypothetical protein
MKDGIADLLQVFDSSEEKWAIVELHTKLGDQKTSDYIMSLLHSV